MLRTLRAAGSSSLAYAFDLVLPPVCVSCSVLVTRHNLLCARCWRELHLITPPLCERLGIPLPGANGPPPHLSAAALVDPPICTRIRAAAHYAGIMRRLIVRFKFEDKHEPLPLFVKLMRDAGRELLAAADLLVPVPLHRLRLLRRRFNQSAVLARELGRQTAIPVAVGALKRIRRTKPQVGLPQGERQHNVAGAFTIAAREHALLWGKNVLLIDDVITTGATVNACAATLRAAGAARVDALAIALVSQGVTESLG
jgi:ComF family protein